MTPGSQRPTPDQAPVAATGLIIVFAVGAFLLPTIFGLWAGIVPFVSALGPQ